MFKPGDIAWNCRTCQSDPTCVQCDPCFRRSDHEGHEVFFHRTSPGGCCDCGDDEAWEWGGCCERHRKARKGGKNKVGDASEAPALTKECDDEGEKRVNEVLPPPLLSVLRGAVGAALETTAETARRAADSTDLGRMLEHLAEEACKIRTNSVDYPVLNEEFQELVKVSFNFKNYLETLLCN